MAFINEWHPVVSKETNRKFVANELIQFCKQYINSTGHSRLEAKLSPIREEHNSVLKEYRSWYENAGFYQATGEVMMEADLENIVLSSYQPAIPQGTTFENIEEHENIEIEDSFFNSFTSGKDRLFLDMTRSQQRISFNFWFSRHRPFHRASILVMNEGKVIGFNVVRVDDDVAEVGPVGIIPEFQKQGIMKAVLHESMKRLVEDGVKAAQLEADGENQPAMKLYRSMGFRIAYNQQYYAWKP
jgi:ribosomal protein S18 acetylase RimI-like enzyme